jgi:NodT family efflux transporter outer membrane factor (OMF) lipoprotein
MTRRFLLLGIAALVLGAAGCATQDPPTREGIRQQAMGRVALTNAWTATRVDTNAPVDRWLTTFGDSTLLALVDEALTNNPDLVVASTRLEQAAGYVDLARSALRPSVGLLGTGGINLGGGDLNSALMGLMVGASWELDLWGRLRYARNAALADYAAVESDLLYARQSLSASVAKGWFTAAEISGQMELMRSVVKSAAELVTLSESRAKVGVGSQQDVALARANLGNAQDLLAQLGLAQSNARRALELLLGRYPAAELRAAQSLPGLPGAVPVGMPLRMLERRPDLVAAERRVAAAFHRVGESKAALLPSLSLNASAAHLQSDVLQLKEDFSNPTAGAGARLVAPIYRGGALVSQVQIRTAEQKTAVADYARMALRAIGEVENALAAGQTLKEREGILRQVVLENERSLVLADQNYRTGSQDLRSVLQQQVAVQNSRLALLRVQSEQLSQRVNLHLALGGGFETAP